MPVPVAAAIKKTLQHSRAVKERMAKARGNLTGAKPSFLLYLGMGMVALLKDMLDLIGVGSFPGIGYVVTLCFNAVIAFLFFFDKAGGKKAKKEIRWIILIVVALIEMVGFGLNFLPIQTLMVLGLYLLGQSAYRQAQKDGAAQESQSQAAENRRLAQEMRFLQAREAADQARKQAEMEKRAANDSEYDQEERKRVA